MVQLALFPRAHIVLVFTQAKEEIINQGSVWRHHQASLGDIDLKAYYSPRDKDLCLSL